MRLAEGVSMVLTVPLLSKKVFFLLSVVYIGEKVTNSPAPTVIKDTMAWDTISATSLLAVSKCLTKIV